MKTRTLLKSIAFITISIFSISVHAQISTNELPPSISTTLFSVRSSDVIELPIPNVAEALHEDSLFADIKDIPYRIGLPISVNYTLENSGKWQMLGDSMRVWSLQLNADGAKAITLNYDRFWIPDGAKLFVYNSDRTFCIGAFTSFNNQGVRNDSKPFATGLVEGDNIIVEYYEPIGSVSGILSIEKVFYIYKNVLVSKPHLRTFWFGDSQPCNVNINCPEGADWQNEKRAVACILFNGYLCSGALINSTSKEDYFLTANHCFSNYDAEGNNHMGQMTFYWNYESADCSNGLNFNPPTSTGATLVSNNSYSDFALLKLIEPVRYVSKYIPYYLGWSRSSDRPLRGITIHHPSGDIKKIAIDNKVLQDAINNTHWRATYDIGTTEGGSSGAPLLNQNKVIVGQLHSGGEGCKISDNFGRFDKSWDYGNVATRRLKDWLDSGNTGIVQLEARDFFPIVNGPLFINANNGYFSINNMPLNGYVMNWSLSFMPSDHLGVGAHSDTSILYYQKYVTDHYDTKLMAEIVLPNSITVFVSKDISVEQQNGVIKGKLDGGPTISFSQAQYVTSRASHAISLNISRGLNIDLDTSTGSASGATYSYDSQNRILYFSLPPVTTGAPFIFKISGVNSCYNGKTITLFVINS